jgi:cyclophilin family peptidyl-prolyl cis-trans isomerase
LDTTLGKVTIALYKQQSPLSVDNFMRYVHSGHYDGTIFHRVIAGFMIQGGGQDAKGVERPTNHPVQNEAKNLLRNSRGAVAMARTSDPDSATAQFFINVKDNHNLDYGIGGAGYTVFGEVIDGMDVVDKIATVTTSKPEDRPITPVVIRTAREVPPGAAPKPAAASPAAPKPAAPSPAGSPKTP